MVGKRLKRISAHIGSRPNLHTYLHTVHRLIRIGQGTSSHLFWFAEEAVCSSDFPTPSNRHHGYFSISQKDLPKVPRQD